MKAGKELNFGEPAILIHVQLVRSIQRTQEDLSKHLNWRHERSGRGHDQLDGVWLAPHWLGFSTRAESDAQVYDFWARGLVGEFAVRNAGTLAAWKARTG